MSYLVLARKWRPQSFEEVVGQGHVTRTLENALRSDRLTHAVLLSGARGVGKTSVARILAKALNCEKGPTPNPCNHCPHCREITAGTAVDVQEIDGASNRGIDEIRQLRENIRFHPSRCRYRVHIIDEVHMLTKEAFNALLKTLEEPPPHVYFIFATTEPQKVPATIHSRCQHYEFRRLSLAELLRHLRRIVQADDLGLDDEALTVLAREAEGSVRDSLSLLDQVAAYGAKSREEVCEALGLVDSLALRHLAEAILSQDAARGLTLLDEIYRFGGDIQGLAADLVLLFRNLVVLRNLSADRARELVDLSEEERKEIAKVAAAHTPQTLFQILETLIRGQEEIHRSSTPKLSFEILLIRLCQLGEVVGLDAILGQIEKLLSKPSPLERAAMTPALAEPTSEPYRTRREDIETSKAEASSPTNEKGTPLPQSPNSLNQAVSARLPAQSTTSHTLTQETWQAFADFVQSRRAPLASLIADCAEPLIQDEANIRLLCRQGVQYDLLSGQTNRQRLSELALEFFGREITITAQKRPGVEPVQTKGMSTCHRRQDLVQSPLVQEALRIFNGRISEVKVFAEKGAGKPRPEDTQDTACAKKNH